MNTLLLHVWSKDSSQLTEQVCVFKPVLVLHIIIAVTINKIKQPFKFITYSLGQSGEQQRQLSLFNMHFLVSVTSEFDVSK